MSGIEFRFVGYSEYTKCRKAVDVAMSASPALACQQCYLFEVHEQRPGRSSFVSAQSIKVPRRYQAEGLLIRVAI